MDGKKLKTANRVTRFHWLTAFLLVHLSTVISVVIQSAFIIKTTSIAVITKVGNRMPNTLRYVFRDAELPIEAYRCIYL